MNLRTSTKIAAALLFVAAAGCTDTTVEPKSTITDANIFTDVNSYRAFLAKIYAGLALSGQQGTGGAGQPDIQGIDEGFSQYLRLYWETEELPTDEAVIGWGDIGLPEMNTQLWSSSSNMVVAMYYRIFFQVSMANEFLRQTEDSVLTRRGVTASMKATIQTYRAEARFLRALSYWHGIDLFGNIPLVKETDPVGATPPPQSTRAEIYDYIVSELNDIKSQLPDAGASTYGRATKPAASMLLAELYLNAQVYTGTAHWAEALTAASDVINSGAYTLDANWRRMFSADNNNSPEIIFPITSDGVHTNTWGGVTFLIHAACGGGPTDPFYQNPSLYGIDGCWWGTRAKQQAYNNYAAGDHRADIFFTTGHTANVTSIGDFTAGMAAPKFTNKTSGGANGSNATFVDTDFPVFRLAEAYLIYAEANLRGGGGSAATALGYVNDLRGRAYGGASGDITAGELTLDFVLAERGRELLWEAHRRTDLVRYGLFTGGTYLWAWKGGAMNGTATDPYRDLYPLPASELVANPNLTQNPGY